jgi:hypothetical protein
MTPHARKTLDHCQDRDKKIPRRDETLILPPSFPLLCKVTPVERSIIYIWGSFAFGNIRNSHYALYVYKYLDTNFDSCPGVHF